MFLAQDAQINTTLREAIAVQASTLALSATMQAVRVAAVEAAQQATSTCQQQAET